MRARRADSDGVVVRDGVEIRYESYGEGSPAILLLPTWSLVPSRHWKTQIPFLARHFTVVCFDGRGCGGSGRPTEASAYSDVAFFVERIFTEPHSTKQIEDTTGWALETDGETLTAADVGIECCDAAATRRLAARLARPVLVIHGTDDALRGYSEGESLAGSASGALVTLAGSGHFPHLRDPVRVNLLIKQFADRVGR